MDSGLSVDRRPTPHLIPGRRGEVAVGIVLHTTVGSLESAIAWFADPASGVSSHYVVGLDGRVVQCVDEHDAARHSRSNRPNAPLFRGRDPNLVSLGIEFEDGGDPDRALRTPAQYRAGAKLIRDVAARWSIPLDRRHVVGHREIDASQTCPGNLDVERLLEEATAPSAPAAPSEPASERRRRTERLVCLLPVRDAEEDLPGYLESAGRFADAVIALDDGSSDRTPSILDESELVEAVLTNPLRTGYARWDDGSNRNRLLEAAGSASADWLMWLDADERIDAGDAAALRQFVERDAIPGLAYGFRVHRMVGDEDHYDSAGLWAYRLFAHRPGQRLADRRLHGVPIPEEIPRSRWVRTTIRIKHLAGLDHRRRVERFAKYAEADPGCAYQETGYEHLLEPPRSAIRWQPRQPGEAVLEPAPHSWAMALPPAVIEVDLEEGPALSAIVIAHDDEDHIDRSVRSVVAQECPEPFEVILVASGFDRTAEVVQERFPQVRVVELRGRALPGAARNAGLRVARGEFVSFPGSHVELQPGSLAARLRAHREGHAMVTGTLLNASRSASGWASYFLDHSAGLPGRGSGPLSGPPDHCSYMRHHLLQVGGFPDEMRAGEDTVVNRELARLGYRAYRAADVRLYHRSPCTNPARLVSHHFTRGRALARIVLDDDAPALRNLLIGYLPRRLSWTSTNVRRWGGPLTTVYRRVLPLVVLGALSSWAGCSYEILRRQAADETPSGRAPSSVSAERNLHLGRETSAVPGASDDGDAAGRALREVQG